MKYARVDYISEPGGFIRSCQRDVKGAPVRVSSSWIISTEDNLISFISFPGCDTLLKVLMSNFKECGFGFCFCFLFKS